MKYDKSEEVIKLYYQLLAKNDPLENNYIFITNLSFNHKYNIKLRLLFVNITVYKILITCNGRNGIGSIFYPSLQYQKYIGNQLFRHYIFIR